MRGDFSPCISVAYISSAGYQLQSHALQCNSYTIHSGSFSLTNDLQPRGNYPLHIFSIRGNIHDIWNYSQTSQSRNAWSLTPGNKEIICPMNGFNVNLNLQIAEPLKVLHKNEIKIRLIHLQA